MSSSGLTYVIPPYLLDTCTGQQLHQELWWLDPALAARNFFSLNKSGYRFRLPQDLKLAPHSFCDDPHIDSIIRDKLREKFSVMGLMGNTPPHTVSSEYLYELYEIFKDRLFSGEDEAEVALEESTGSHREGNTPGSHNHLSLHMELTSVSVHLHLLARGSVFDIPHYGELLYKVAPKDKHSRSFGTCSLKHLLSWAREKKENKYSFFPYLMQDQRKVFLSRLPMYWTPLSANDHLKRLDERFGLESGIEDGYSVLRLKLSRGNPDLEEYYTHRKRFFNFISNNEVQENTGVFYYEVSIEQTATSNTNYETIIQANDPSLSSGSALFFNMGFTKRNIKYDKIPSSTSTLSDTTMTIDLKEIQSELCLHNLQLSGSKMDDDTVRFLGTEPGVTFEGSLAISFNNSCSYASIKKNHGSFRGSSLNLNRRFSQLNRHGSEDQETSKLDIDAPFYTHPLPETEGKKHSRTDTVGFGVNFIERSFFITLNGVVVKTIYEQDITSSNRYQDSIFGQGSELSHLYPMIGFRIPEFSNLPSLGDLPESKIITNFGLKSFQFNIENYVKNLKITQKKELKSVILDEINNVTTADSTDMNIVKFEKAVRNIQEDSSILSHLIEGYLIQEGYLGTLDCFKADLQELSKSIAQIPDEDMEVDNDSHLLTQRVLQSKAVQRRRVRQSILDRNFETAKILLQEDFPYLQRLDVFLFELDLLHYIELLRNVFVYKFQDSGKQFGTGTDGQRSSREIEESLLKEAFSLGQDIMRKAGDDTADELAQLSSTLLLHSKDDLKTLPEAYKLFQRHTNDIKVLANMINSEILEEHDFSKTSRLESMIVSARNNVSKLSSENKNPFRLANFDEDYMKN